MRQMECRLTVDAVLERRKRCTRRAASTWVNLRVGEQLRLVDRLRVPAAEQRTLAVVTVTNVRLEPLFAITPMEVMLEGFDHADPERFVRFWMETHDASSSAVLVRRIEWAYDGERVCRSCGCTDLNCARCIERNGEPCRWLSDTQCDGCLVVGGAG